MTLNFPNERVISHRGNIIGPNPIRENTPNYINEAIDQGYIVEIDIRMRGDRFYLSHDEIKPDDYSTPFVDYKWLTKRRNKLILHIKDLQHIDNLSYFDSKFPEWFYHTNEKFVLTSKGRIWCYPEIVIANSVLVVEKNTIDTNKENTYLYNRITTYINHHNLSICTDWALDWRNYIDIKS